MKFNTIIVIVIAIGMLLAMWIAAVTRVEPAVWPGAHSASPSVTHP